ncbi:uncharacterized protein LOC116770101 [Danaus plexippus]|nr:uncharacterized protein LOC116770101 [Danaus plexippus]
MVLYELVGKCVSVSPGDRSAQNLVVRDESGPAMQVVYYEIDLLLPDLSLPCTVRVVGRMLSGSSRMQGFSVRVARADDVTALSRRTAVAMNQVEELIKKYGGST